MKNKHYTKLLLAVFLPAAIFVHSCKKPEDIEAKPQKPEVELKDKSADGQKRIPVIHLSKDTVYILSTSFSRQTGEQLIIDAGTLIKVKTDGGMPGITIMPGGIIAANGNAQNPVVFTANKRPGDQSANWLGLTIQGKSFNNDIINNLAAIPADGSGSLQYVRIEFAPLTLQAVGSNTIINHVMVSYASQASAITISGGSFNARYLVSYACGGAADFYITKGYSGNMQNLLAYRHPYFGQTGAAPFASLAGLFIENNPSRPVQARPYTNPIISNITIIGPDEQIGKPPVYADTSAATRCAALVTTRSTCFRIRNAAILGFPAGAWYLDDAETALNLQAGNAEMKFTTVHSNMAGRTFYLKPGVVAPFMSADFRTYMLQPAFVNRQYNAAGNFSFENIFNYDAPNVMPKNDSPLLTDSTSFDGTFYSTYFEKQHYRGAIGRDNWLAGWSNFTPLKTNYNFPQ
jgi:hypothetical protein